HVQGIVVQRASFAGGGKAASAGRRSAARTAIKTRTAEFAAFLVYYVRAAERIFDGRTAPADADRSVVHRTASRSDGTSGFVRRRRSRRRFRRSCAKGEGIRIVGQAHLVSDRFDRSGSSRTPFGFGCSNGL